jgi:hypothetical protein
MILRNFLFLDTATMTDYLSTLEGYVVEGTVDQTDVGKREKGGKLAAKVIEGGASSEVSTETKQKLTVPDAAKFQRLYEILEEQDLIQYLDAFDEEIWNQLKRGELLEVQAAIRLPELLAVTKMVEDLSPLLGVMTALGQDPLDDPEARVAFDGMREVGKLTKQKHVPLLFEAVSTPGFRFVANLPRQYIRRPLSDLQGEAVVFGKIQRILTKGQKYEAFSLLPPSASFPTRRSLTKEQRRKRRQAKKGLTEMVNGPAIVLTPLAVFR